MSVLFHLGHPAHFHLFKNVMYALQQEEYIVHILIKEKDVLKNLLDESGFVYENILPDGKSAGSLGLFTDFIHKSRRLIGFCKKYRPKLLIGTSAEISLVGKLTGIPAINVNEDDAHVVPKYAWTSYPFATKIFSPSSCNNGRWQDKTITYQGYHELAYLHPDHFQPNEEIAGKYVNTDNSFFVLRFAKLNAHHDSGIRGINNTLAGRLISELKKYGDVFITSERPLTEEFEPHRLHIKPTDIHHVLSFANIVIGDSQTMSAEAGVLGTPYIRFNDFVGKIGYLKELEEKYKLGFGIKPDDPEELIQKAIELATNDNLKNDFLKKRKRMLSEKINVADFILNQIKQYLE